MSYESIDFLCIVSIHTRYTAKMVRDVKYSCLFSYYYLLTTTKSRALRQIKFVSVPQPYTFSSFLRVNSSRGKLQMCFPARDAVV